MKPVAVIEHLLSRGFTRVEAFTIIAYFIWLDVDTEVTPEKLDERIPLWRAVFNECPQTFDTVESYYQGEPDESF